MKIKEHINYWIKSADHDLNTAESLFKAKKYDWCLFLGHLVLEKTLKAIWVRDNNNKTPPRTHNLMKLAGEIKFIFNEKIKLQLLNINDFHIESRYPDYKLKFYKKCTKKFSENYFKIIKDIHKCLKEQL